MCERSIGLRKLSSPGTLLVMSPATNGEATKCVWQAEELPATPLVKRRTELQVPLRPERDLEAGPLIDRDR